MPEVERLALIARCVVVLERLSVSWAEAEQAKPSRADIAVAAEEVCAALLSLMRGERLSFALAMMTDDEGRQR